jgi:hypothetical protein
MSTKIKKKKKVVPPKAQTSMPFKGEGVEELRIKEVDDALDVLFKDLDELVKAEEARDDSKKLAVELMHKHKDKMVQEVKGGFSYAYDCRIVKIAPTSEKLTVKVIHDKNLGPAEDAS